MSALPPSPDERPLAVFDLDGTLVRSDTLLPFLTSYALRRRRPWPLAVLPAYLTLYACRALSARAVKERLCVTFFRGVPVESIADHAEWFFGNWVEKRLRPLAMEKLREHQDAGHRTILLSASPDLYVPVFGRRLGIAEVICTRVASADGRCLGTLLGPNCKGQAKVELLRAHLGRQTAPARSFAYGDSHSDLPILAWATTGYLCRANGSLVRV